MIVLSLGIYTVIEATFVSRYIGRNIVLPIAATYIMSIIQHKDEAVRYAK